MTRDPDERHVLRATFDEDAELYARVRPGYPQELFDDLGDLAALGPGSRMLELGAGTGQATAALAGLGAEVVAIELGADLAGVARRRLAAITEVEVVNASFEAWPLPAHPFDAVASFTAWHWLDPEVRTRRAAKALRPGGALATVATRHVAGGSEGFFAEVQRCYERWDPATPSDFRLPSSASVAPQHDEINTSRLFEAPMLRRYEWTQPYSTAAYLDLLCSYSNHRRLTPTRRARLLGCIGELIERSYAGEVVKRYLNELRVARRSAEPA